jgi:hypothetical protein
MGLMYIPEESRWVSGADLLSWTEYHGGEREVMFSCESDGKGR